jgi:hypothetical protein
MATCTRILNFYYYLNIYYCYVMLRHFEFETIWRIRVVSLNFVIILKRCYDKQRRHFEFFGNMADTRVIFKLNFELCYLNKAAIFTIWRTRALNLNLLAT